MMNSILCVLLLCFVIAQCENVCDENGKKIICYYSSWSYYRQSNGYFNISHIDPNLCTHLVYTFAGLDLNGQMTALDASYDTNGGYANFNGLKNDNPCLKTVLAIGGWNEGSRKYSVMASTPESREKFADSVLRLLAAYDFDGLDFDWEYPTQRGGIPEDKQNFIEVLKLLKEKFRRWGLSISIAVPISEEINRDAYDVKTINELVDTVSVMAYDYTPTNSPVTGLIAPLSSIKSTIDFWIKEGMPAEKLMLGVPTYARTFNLQETCNANNMIVATNGTGAPGTYTQEAGFLSYYELLAKLTTNRYTKVKKDSNYYACYKKEWFSFDLEDTYLEKAQYAKDKGLGGVMVWTIDTDDFSGSYSNQKKYPILQSLNEIIRSR